MGETIALYETNWSLFGVDGELLPGPTSPLCDEWHQQDDLIKIGEGPAAGPPNLVDELSEIEEQLSPNENSWLDSKTDLVELLLGVKKETDMEAMPLSSTSEVKPGSGEEAIEQLLESLERDVPEGIVDLDNGQTGSAALYELLTSEDSEYNSGVTLSIDEIETVLSSNPPSPAESMDASFESDPNWSPSHDHKQSRRNARLTPYEKQGRSVYSNKDKKLRKKEQNRTAATRYRIKKREEQGEVVSEYLKLETRNKELKETVASISKEISYLKNLMAEVYKAKKALKDKK